ncbi:Spc98 family-domain-containing protein [Piptocephalis cylindrospora]|uniref:Spindle pole body component n=1 Tax=Piptocephalis cylindrospora TaxID=1907219 RepID=A0A4P9Y5M5_9FUNG|nr:Spc98 family-domain-containing protein [Piptocephalis cylindrospora]|eukprot:RKP14253.1 Spc98 family-domain-containing protein [Piptocephalis cylindrospora]
MTLLLGLSYRPTASGHLPSEDSLVLLGMKQGSASDGTDLLKSPTRDAIVEASASLGQHWEIPSFSDGDGDSCDSEGWTEEEEEEGDRIRRIHEAVEKHPMLTPSAFRHVLETFLPLGRALFQIRFFCTKALQGPQKGMTRVVERFCLGLQEEMDRFSSLLGILIRETWSSHVPGPDLHQCTSLTHVAESLRPYSQIFPQLASCLPSSDEERPFLTTTILLDTLQARAEVVWMADAAGQITQVWGRLFSQCFSVYLDMVERWVTVGVLEDPFEEFCIYRNDRVTLRSSLFWEQGISIRYKSSGQKGRGYGRARSGEDVCVPRLILPHFGDILYAGRCAYLMRELRLVKPLSMICRGFRMNPLRHPIEEGDIKCPDNPFEIRTMPSRSLETLLIPPSPKLESMHFPGRSELWKEDSMMDDCPSLTHPWDPPCIVMQSRLGQVLHQHYLDIGQAFSRVLHQRYGLYRHLNSLHQLYYLLEGDSMHLYAMELFHRIRLGLDRMGAQEMTSHVRALLPPTGPIDRQRVTVVIEEGEQGTSGGWRGNVGQDEDLSFTRHMYLDYRISWPLDNIISQDSLIKYREIQRWVMRIKLSRYLAQSPQLISRFSAKDQDETCRFMYSLRLRLLSFINGFYTYLMTNVLHAESAAFMARIGETFDIQKMIEAHAAHVDQVHKQCFLDPAASALRRSVQAIVEAIGRFDRISRHFQSTPMNRPSRTTLSGPGQRFKGQLEQLHKEFIKHHDFFLTSLRIIARSAGNDHGADLEANILSVPGADYQLIDLDTDKPLLRVGRTHWQGRWDQQVGTELVYESITDQHGEEKAVEVCKTVKRLIFNRVYLQPRQDIHPVDESSPLGPSS